MALGLANKYYEGEGELNVDGLCEDPQVINWYVINYKGQLQGKIACSDVFGVELDQDKFVKPPPIEPDEPISLQTFSKITEMRLSQKQNN